MTRMAHEKHGYHNAYSETEVKSLLELGWKVESEEEFRLKIALKNIDSIDSNKANSSELSKNQKNQLAGKTSGVKNGYGKLSN